MTTYQQLCRKAARRRYPRPQKRDGSVTLEFLLVLPILLIVLLAAIEFGMFFANIQQVALACRVGAEAASQTPGLPDGPDLVPTNITDAINHQLASSGISPCRVYLEHNLSGIEQELVTAYVPACTCTAPATALPPQPPPATDYGRVSVRVTVCVPMTELAPNCLALFGFNLTGRCATCSTTFRHEG